MNYLCLGAEPPRAVAYIGGWFGVAVTALVKSTKLSYVERLVMTVGASIIPVFIQATKAHSAWSSLHGWVQGVPEMV